MSGNHDAPFVITGRIYCRLAAFQEFGNFIGLDQRYADDERFRAHS